MDGQQSESLSSNAARGDSSNPNSTDGPQSESLVYLLQFGSLGSNGSHHSSNQENNEYDPKYADLYQAVRTGNLTATKEFLEEHPEAVAARISTEGKRPLHVAALFGHLEIVKELLRRMSAEMSKEHVKSQDNNLLTALHEAIYGGTDLAACLIEKNSELLVIPDIQDLLPITRAFGFGQIKMVRYLYPLMPRRVMQGTHGARLLKLCCYSKMFDIALDLLAKCPRLAVTSGFLEAMARTPSAFPSGCQLSFWQRWIYNWINIPKEQLGTFNREAQHETIQPNSLNEDIRVGMPETPTSQSEENGIDNLNEQLGASFPEAQHETIQANSPNEDIRVGMPETPTSQSEENRIDNPNEQQGTLFSEAQRQTIQPNSLNEDIRVGVPETTASQSKEMISFFGIKNIYQIKLAHMQARELLRIACQVLLRLKEEQIQTSRAREAVVQATRNGIPEIFTEVLKVRLDLFWVGYRSRCLMFDAVEFRQARVFSLIHGMSWKNAVANLIDYNQNTLLHTAGLLGPSTELQLHGISGAALQMQRELQWFKEVESITPSDAKEARNREGYTARQFFTEHHKELVKQGEKWMKGTATSCSVVASLVATIVFAVAFTVPGGNNQNTGYPIFSEKMVFMVFIISDALSLFSSTTSILMFLGILTSRYAEDDFLKSLPTKLIIGLLTLFISMASMLIAFCAALFVMFRGELWIVIPVSFLAAVPVISFCWLQFPLLREMIMSTYGPSIFDRDVGPWAMADLI